MKKFTKRVGALAIAASMLLSMVMTASAAYYQISVTFTGKNSQGVTKTITAESSESLTGKESFAVIVGQLVGSKSTSKQRATHLEHIAHKNPAACGDACALYQLWTVARDVEFDEGKGAFGSGNNATTWEGWVKELKDYSGSEELVTWLRDLDTTIAESIGADPGTPYIVNYMGCTMKVVATVRSSGSGSGSSSGSSSGSTTTTTNPDGSTTTTTTNKDGSVTQTTTKTETTTDGTKVDTEVKTETGKDGSQTTTETKTETSTDGSKTETTTKTETSTDGSKTETTTKTETSADGSQATTESKTETNKDGSQTTTETKTETSTDGSKTETTTKTETSTDGSKTETTTKTETSADGSQTTTETKTETNADGSETKTEIKTETDADGSETKTETRTETDADGSKSEVITDSNGVTVTTKTDKDGNASATTVVIPEEFANSGETIVLPVDGKTELEVDIPESADKVTIEIRAEDLTSDTEVVIVGPDGTETVLKPTQTEKGLIITLDGDATLKIVEKAKRFVDIDGHWAEKAINYVADRGLFAGTGDGTTFSPEIRLDRAMMAQIVYNLEGKESHNYVHGFPDVPDGKWYSKAINWAAREDVVAGYGDGLYRPEKLLSREEVVQIFYNYAMALGLDVSKRANLSSYPDEASISGWARAAMEWGINSGLVAGKGGGYIDPLANTTRAECAQMFMNFLERIVVNG